MSDDLPAPGPTADNGAVLEVGAAGSELRYWRAKEAMRHAKLRLAAPLSGAITLALSPDAKPRFVP
jgi:hypothetical protein